MSFIVVMESRCVREHSCTLENGHCSPCLFGGGQDAEHTFTAGDGDAFAFELADDVGLAPVRG